MNSLINEYCTQIYNQKQPLSTTQVKSLFDSIVNELNNENNHSTIDDYTNIINALKFIPCSILIDQSIVNNQIFHFIQIFLIHILDKWSKDVEYLTNQDECLFQEILRLYHKMIKNLRTTHQISSSTFKTWFLNESFFKTIAFVLEDISLNFHKYIKQDQNMKNLTMLIRSIEYYKAGNDHIKNNPNILLIIDPLIKCLCSSIYIKTLKSIDIKSIERTEFENFILITCPCYCAWYRGKAQITMIDGLCSNRMLTFYQEIYDLFLPSIELWEEALMESIYYMTALLRYVAYYPSTRVYLNTNVKLIDSMLIILNSNCLLDNILITNDFNSKTNLTDSAISFIFNLIDDCDMLTLIIENSFFSKEIFIRLKDAEVDRVKLHALMILSKILNQEDILNLDDSAEITTIFMNYLSEAMNDSNHSFQDVPIESLLKSLKAFIQHDEIKENIAKQNYLSILIRCATEKSFHVGLVLQISLEIIWSLIFNIQICQMLMNNYGNIFISLKEILINSTDEGVRAAAKGILWELESNSLVNRSIIATDENNTMDKKYDIMISYSHTNKDLCHEIYQHLINLNYKVWLDCESMYGSTLESMALAIETSEIILICVSSSYKMSPYCQSEAHYAFTRKLNIIPLFMEKKYKPDGWLGLICARKLYVDFTKTDFEQAFQKLISQIEHHRQQTTTSNEMKESHIHECDSRSTFVNNVEETSQIEEQEMITNDESNYDCRYLEWWTHEDILRFLHDKKFDIMKSLFENEPNFNGHSLYALYERSQSNVESTYQLLDSQLNFTHNDHLPYVTYIRFLTELRHQLNPIDLKYIIRCFLWRIWKTIHFH